jgi:hypothetical protein
MRPGLSGTRWVGFSCRGRLRPMTVERSSVRIGLGALRPTLRQKTQHQIHASERNPSARRATITEQPQPPRLDPRRDPKVLYLGPTRYGLRSCPAGDGRRLCASQPDQLAADLPGSCLVPLALVGDALGRMEYVAGPEEAGAPVDVSLLGPDHLGGIHERECHCGRTRAIAAPAFMTNLSKTWLVSGFSV